jgi:DNA-binding response OmpR family regulator
MILFVDDERRDNTSYLDELRMSGFKVEFRKDVSVAFSFLSEHLAEIELLILDVMMPRSTLFTEEETNGGLRTGLRFYEKVRQIAPTLPIIILTNVSDTSISTMFQDDTNCFFHRKEDRLPFELAEDVKAVLDKTTRPSPSETTPQ